MKITNNTTSYGSYQPMTNKLEKKEHSATEIKHNNTYESASDKRMQLMQDKYSKIHQQNMRYSNPKEHINNKYSNHTSKEFRHDLSPKERDVAWRAEMSMLKDGKVGFYDVEDSLFRNSDPINGIVENHQKKAFQRDQVNKQIQNLLSQNNIFIPNDLHATFTINPNDFQVSVTGDKNSELLQQIEQLLNDKKNGKELFYHIFQSNHYKSEQMKQEAVDKFGLVSAIRSETGYNLRDLERKDGTFLTPDGQDVFQLYLSRMRQNPYNRNNVNAAASIYGPTYFDLAKNGFDSMPDLTLSINYHNNKLHDIGQRENYSDIQWITALEQSVKNQK